MKFKTHIFILKSLMLFLVLGTNISVAGNKDTVFNYNSNPCLFSIHHNPTLLNNDEAIRAGLMFDMDSQTIVWQKDLNYAYPIASLTKMMVALLAIEDIRASKVHWDDQVSVNRVYYRGRGRYKKKYSVEEVYSLRDLITMAMVPSHNESTHWIAKHLNGSVEVFVERMNKRAVELNMMQTHFTNPSGLPAPSSSLDNSSTPYDILLLSLELVKYPELLNITKIGYAEIHNGRSNQVYRNHNGLVRQYEDDIDGLKTGYTRNAKFCLAATSIKENKRLICIVFGVSDVYTRNALVAKLMSSYYQSMGMLALGNKSDTQLEKEPSSEGVVEDLTASVNSEEEEDEPVELVKTV
ncbi:MAG TPA: serine hydrolase, partial [Bacteroidia bacterium]|nr:serine hydrolase [Bacteroidia bacterium]